MNRNFKYFIVAVVAIFALTVEAGLTGSTFAHTSAQNHSNTGQGSAVQAAQTSNQSPGQLAWTVFQAINRSRTTYGLPALRWSSALMGGAHLHNLKMSAANRLDHIVRGEAGFATRLNLDGIRWFWGGENIGVTTDASTGGALHLHSMMMSERPPAETGHRDNILSSFPNVLGVDVLIDGNHELWLTEDFAKI